MVALKVRCKSAYYADIDTHLIAGYAGVVFDEEVAYPIVFGMVIGNLREHLRPEPLTQAELAALAGISQATLSRIEAGLLRPDVVTARCLAIELGLTYEQLSARVEVMLAKTREYATKTIPRRARSAPWIDDVVKLAGVVGAFALVAMAVDSLTPTRPQRRRPKRPARRRRS